MVKVLYPYVKGKINPQDVHGRTPLSYAFQNESVRLCKALVSNGAHLGIPDNNGQSCHDIRTDDKQLILKLLNAITAEPAWIETKVCQGPSCESGSKGGRQKFGTSNRKHHCRHCGICVCKKCSNQSVPISKFNLQKPQRVCDPCFLVLSGAVDLREKPSKGKMPNQPPQNKGKRANQSGGNGNNASVNGGRGPNPHEDRSKAGPVGQHRPESTAGVSRSGGKGGNVGGNTQSIQGGAGAGGAQEDARKGQGPAPPWAQGAGGNEVAQGRGQETRKQNPFPNGPSNAAPFPPSTGGAFPSASGSQRPGQDSYGPGRNPPPPWAKSSDGRANPFGSGSGGNMGGVGAGSFAPAGNRGTANADAVAGGLSQPKGPRPPWAGEQNQGARPSWANS